MNKRCLIAALAIMGVVGSLSATSPELRDKYKTERKALEKAETDLTLLKQLAQRKVEIRKLEAEGQTQKVLDAFRSDRSALDKQLEGDDSQAIQAEYKNLYSVYGRITSVQDQFLYYQAMVAVKTGAFDRDTVVNQNLTQLIAQFPQSDKLVPALYLIQRNRLTSGSEEQWQYMVADYEQFRGRLKSGSDEERQLRYWQAQALYNLGLYDQSRAVFNTFADDSEYGFRAKLMLALIVNDTEGAAAFDQSLSALATAYKNTEPFYGYIPLNRARIAFADRNYSASVSLYQEYMQLVGDNATNEDRYEYADALRMNGDTGAAKLQLNSIIDNKNNNSYFIQANYLMSIIDQDAGNLESAQQYLNTAMASTQSIVDLLNHKFELMTRYRQLVEQNTTLLTDAERTAMETELNQVKEDLKSTSAQIATLSSGLDQEKIDELNNLERDFLARNTDVATMQQEIKKLEVTPYTRGAEQIQKKIDDLDYDLNVLEAYRYLASMPNPKRDDFILAFNLAGDIASTQKTMGVWQQRETQAKAKNDYVNVGKARAVQDTLKSDLGYLQKLVYDRFGPINTDNPNQATIEAERQSILKKQDDLRQLKEQVLAEYNKKMAFKREEQKEEVQTQVVSIQDKYSSLMKEIDSEAENNNQRFKATWLGIQYRQTEKDDAEWNKVKAAEPKGNAPENSSQGDGQ